MKITPTKSVVAGGNGTVAGLEALARSLEKRQLMESFSVFGMFFESVEDFEQRMKLEVGDNWINILK